MAEFETRRVAVSREVELAVAIAGSPKNPPIILLHGFPESHRTWREQIVELALDHFVVAPDQRGFGGSSKPVGADNYVPAKPIGDLLALADHFGVGEFTLAGHDWGGAVAWAAALKHPDRIGRLIIVNAPHPLIFQRSLFDDRSQRNASQYINAYRDPGFEDTIERLGLSNYFDQHFDHYADLQKLAEEKPIYLDQWGQPGALTAMLNWYRATPLIVPDVDASPDRPAFLDATFPTVQPPTLVIWGTADKALLTAQLEGLDSLVRDLTIVRLEGVGHFAPWEAPAAVTGAMKAWLESRPTPQSLVAP